MSDPDILFISNGHGEDAVAARIARELPDLARAGLPLVGSGAAYREQGIPVLGPARDLPSGGWLLRYPAALLRDWRGGWLRDLREALDAARGVRPRLVVGVGDLLPAAFAALAGFPPIVLVGCNKTDHYSSWGESYISVEIAALRCWDTEVLPRDALTAGRLARLGLRVRYLGNVIPDLVGALPPPGDGIALLPGSREDARANLPLMLEAVRLLGTVPAVGHLGTVPVTVALAPGFEDLREAAEAAGAEVTDLEGALAPAGIAVATAGTAAEVAAAHGRPVIGFAGPGPQYTESFAARQRELLGGAIRLVGRDPRLVSEAIVHLRDDPAAATKAGDAGRQGGGEGGAAARVAGHLLDALRLTWLPSNRPGPAGRPRSRSATVVGATRANYAAGE